MSDLISKRSATERLIIAKTLLESVLQNMSTAERRNGKWEIDVDCEYSVFDIAGERTWAIKATCSECGFTTSFIEGHGVYNYCPKCGVRMEEDDEA